MKYVPPASTNFNESRFKVSATVSVLPGAIFSYHAPRYLELGYSPVPAFEGGKYPPAWSDYCVTAAPLDQIERWGKAHNANITLACGYGRLVVIDADTKQTPILDAIRGALPQEGETPYGPKSLIARYGSKGFALFFRHLDPAVASGDKTFKSIYWPEPNTPPMVEILACGRNIHVPPSVHRKAGRCYTWIDVESGVTLCGDTPLIYPPPLAELPVIDDADLDRLRAALAPWARQPRAFQPKADKGGQRPSDKRLEAWYRAGLNNARSMLSGLREGGGRPTALFKSVCSLGASVHHGFIPRIEFENAFLEACNHNGLIARDGQRAIQATIDSGLSKSENDDLPDLGDREPPPRLKKRQAKGNSAEEASQAEAAEPTDNLPVIEVRGGALSENAGEAEAALRAANVEIYRQRGILVRPVRLDARDSKRNEVQVPALTNVTTTYLRDMCGRHIKWQKWSARKKGLVATDPPRDVAEIILHRKGEGRNWRTIAGVTGTPFLRADGSIVSKPGFDDATGMFLMDPVALPDMPTRPGKADAERALAILENDLLAEFPFMDPKEDAEEDGIPILTPAQRKLTGSHAVALSQLLTPLGRSAIAVAPMHAAKAFVAGTGKSYLADIASAISIGTACPVIAAGADEEEMEKRLASMMFAGVTIIAIDNANREIAGDLLCQAISQEFVCPRILSKSESPPLTNTFTIFANGNNISVHIDLVRRTLFAVMNAGLDEKGVQEREFERCPVAMVLADRGRYIAAALTILRAHHLAGYPGAKDLKPYATFGDWSRVVRGAIVWLGRADPVDTIAVGRASARKDEHEAFLDAFVTVFGYGPGKAEKVSRIVEASSEVQQELEVMKDARATISASFKSFADFKGDVSVDKVGRWLKSFEQKVIGGKVLQRRIIDGRTCWYVSAQTPF
jgi:putative DNA primase/helicase